jgi:hypothetical protein
MNKNGKLDRSIDGKRFVAIGGRAYEILGTDDGLELQLRDIEHDLTKASSLRELLMDRTVIFAASLSGLMRRLAESSVKPLAVPSAAVDSVYLERADWCIATVERIEAIVNEKRSVWDVNKGALRRGQVLAAACAEWSRQTGRSVGVACYYKYRRRCREHGFNRIAIAAALRRSDAGKSRLSAAQNHVMDICILMFYADRKTAVRPSTVYRLMSETLRELDYWWVNPEKCAGQIPENIVESLIRLSVPIETLRSNPDTARVLDRVSLPSRTTFYKYLRWHIENQSASRAAMISRIGQATWDRQHKNFDHFANVVSRLLQLVVADHLLLDTYSIDDNGKSVRLWLTMLIDVWSRGILGFVLLAEEPSANSILLALKNSIWPHDESELLRMGIDQPWICYGIPGSLSLDNAWAHTSASLRNLPHAMNPRGDFTTMYLDYRPIYTARYGALIERMFGNLAGQLREFVPGTIQQTDPAGIRKAQKGACLHYRDLLEIITKLVVMYQHSPHSELGGRTPHQMWLSGIQEFGPVIVPPRTQEAELLFWPEYHDTRAITDKGIRFLGLHYFLENHSKAARIGHDGKPVRYTIRYNPLDISRIAVYRRISEGYRTLDETFVGLAYARQLKLPDGTVESLSMAERDLARQLDRKHNEGTNSQGWLRFWKQVKARSGQRTVERKQRERASEKSDANAVQHEKVSSHMITAKLRESSSGEDLQELLREFVEADKH